MSSLVQIFHVNAIVVGTTRHEFDGDLSCQFFPHGPLAAHFVLTPLFDILDGEIAWDDHCEIGAVKEIEYTIIAVCGTKVLRQQYRHEFTTPVKIDGDGFMSALRGALFIPYQLDVLVDSNQFPKVTSVQFIA